MRRRYALYLGLICLMAVIVRVMAIVALGPNTMRFPDERVYFSIAESVSAGDGYQYKGKPTAYLAPVLPMVIAATISVCGDNPCAVKFLFALLSGLVVYLIASVGRLFSERAALLAALLFALYPMQVFVQTTLYPQFLGSLWVAGLFALTFLWKNEKKAFWWFLFGIYLGVGSLLITMLLFIALPVFVYALSSSDWRSWLLKTVCVFVGFLVVMCPWWLRNYRVMGEFVPFTANGGLNLWIGNNELTTPNSGFRPRLLRTDLIAVEPEDELERDRWYQKLALKYIREHPGRTLVLYLGKLANYFRPWTSTVTRTDVSGRKFQLVSAVFFIPLFLLALWGFAHHRKDPRAVTMLSSFILFGAGYAVFFTRVRFRAPAEIVLYLLAALAIDSILKKRKEKKI